jgi:hypothetical protein
MSQVRIVEQNYFEFTAALREAADNGYRVEPREKERWQSFVKENRIQEAAFKSLADKKYEGMKPVIIEQDGPWQGYYRYTTAEEAVLKWVREES